MPEPADSCRPVLLPSGEAIRVRGVAPMGPEAVAVLGEVVAAARRRMAAEHPPEPGSEDLYERIRARCDTLDISLRGVAFQTGVRFATLIRIEQGIMPDRDALAAIEDWLTSEDPDA